MNNKIIGVIIAASIAILMSGSVLMPVINDAVDDTKIYFNNELGGFSKISDGSDVDINIVPTGNTTGTIHNMVIDGVSTPISNVLHSLIMGDRFVVSQTNSQTLALAYVDGETVQYVTFDSGVSLAVSLSDNVAVVSNGTDNYTISFDWCFYRDDASDSYKMIDTLSGKRTVYLNDLSQVYASNRISTTGEYFTLNGTDVKIYGDNGSATATFDGLTQVMNGVISFDVSPITLSGSREYGVHFTVLNGDGDYEVFPYFLIVPASVYGQTETNESYTALLYAIPVILLTAIAATIAMMFARRY